MLGPSEWMIGKHTFRWAPPDVLWVAINGDNSLEEVKEMIALYRALGEVQPYFIMGNAGNAGRLEPEARRYMSEHLRHEWLLEVIFYNARLVQRAVAHGLLIAAELFRAEASPMRGRVHFVSNLDRAEALLAQIRATERWERPGNAPMHAPLTGSGSPPRTE